MKRNTLLLLIWFSIFNLSAQIQFETHIIIDNSTVDDTRSVHGVDLDGDGDMDILSASGGADKISWYENIDGVGNFGAQQIITDNVEGAYSVYAEDLDGDGDMDVLSASREDDKIAWYENLDGLGNFGTQELITLNANGAYSVYAKDLDGDGDMDVLSASELDDKIAWYENTDGLGNFGVEQVIMANVDGANSVYAADIDSDGDMDVLSASFLDDKIAWYENLDGLGNFGVQQPISNNADRASAVFALDLDGDGDMDVLSASDLDDKIAWYENLDGQGGFSAQQIISTSANGALSIYAIDLDGDGDNDVLSASELDDKIAWYENLDGLGSFGEEQIISEYADKARFVFAVDIDGDGDMDVLSSSTGDNKVAWYENANGLGDFGIQEIISANSTSAASVYATDIDNDGDMDVLSASRSEIAWYKNEDGIGNFSNQNIISADINIQLGVSVFSADIDGDGDVDVLSTSFTDNKIIWHRNVDGEGNQWESQIIGTESGAHIVYASDLDGDGDIDVLAGASSSDQITWYQNLDGLGSFGTQQIINQNVNVTNTIYSVDIDDDSDLDVLSASYDGIIFWHENEDGLGNFGNQQSISINAEQPYSVYAADLDNDGDVDVLSTSSDGGIAWYENTNSLGIFDTPKIITENTLGAVSIIAKDIDGDNDIDVFSASELDDKIAWYENLDGLGNFGNQQIISTNAEKPFSVYATDIDGDGDMDILSASFDDGKIAWYENKGPVNTISHTNLSNLNFDVYPNPTTNQITINAPTNITQIKIYNSLGQLMLSNTNTTEIDLTNLAKGLYFCKVKDIDGNFGIRKVVKE